MLAALAEPERALRMRSHDLLLDQHLVVGQVRVRAQILVFGRLPDWGPCCCALFMATAYSCWRTVVGGGVANAGEGDPLRRAVDGVDHALRTLKACVSGRRSTSIDTRRLIPTRLIFLV